MRQIHICFSATEKICFSEVIKSCENCVTQMSLLQHVATERTEKLVTCVMTDLTASWWVKGKLVLVLLISALDDYTLFVSHLESWEEKEDNFIFLIFIF